MNKDKPPSPTSEQQERPANQEGQNELVSVDQISESDRSVLLKRDDAKLEEIRNSLGLQEFQESDILKHLQEYLALPEGGVEKIELLKAKDLPSNYAEQREFLHDERLDNVNIAIIPDELWVKGDQPSETDADKQLILIKQSYFEAQENPDEIAWMCHELAHCQNFLDSETPKAYQEKKQKFAFPELQTEYQYPNNPVERYTFTKQFKFLKDKGKSRDDVSEMIKKYYEEHDIPFFNKILDEVYG